MLDEGVAGRMPDVALGPWGWGKLNGSHLEWRYWDLFPSPVELWCKSGEPSLQWGGHRTLLIPQRSVANQVLLWNEWQMIRGC